MSFLIFKGIISVAGFLFGKLTAGLPFLLQYLSGKQKDNAEIERLRIQAELRKNEAVAEAEEYKAQAAVLRETLESRIDLEVQKRLTLQAQAEADHQKSIDEGENKILDSTDSINKPLPFADPKGLWEKLIDALVVATNAVNAWMRPYSFAVVINLWAGLCIIEIWGALRHPEWLQSLNNPTDGVLALGIFEVLTDLLVMMAGHLWDERSYRHRLEG